MDSVDRKLSVINREIQTDANWLVLWSKMQPISKQVLDML